MDIQELKKPEGISKNKKLSDKYLELDDLLTELRSRDIPQDVKSGINNYLTDLNRPSGSDRERLKAISKARRAILKLLEKKLKIVPKGYYRTIWLPIGMAAFGIPMGAAFGASQGNMAFLGAGLPIGMALGVAVGIALDKKAKDSGKQLKADIKF